MAQPRDEALREIAAKRQGLTPDQEQALAPLAALLLEALRLYQAAQDAAAVSAADSVNNGSR